MRKLALKEARIEHGYKWPWQIKGVMFYDGFEITRKEFEG